MPRAPAAVAEVPIGLFAAEVGGDIIRGERIGRGDGLGLAAEALDGLRGAAALPEADEPKAVHAAVAEYVELFVGNLIQAGDGASVLERELMQPDVGALGDEHDVGHPLDVGAEALIFDIGDAELRHVGVAAHLELVPLLAALASASATGVGMKAHPDGGLFFFEHIDGEQQAAKVGAEYPGPFFAKKGELPGERVGRREHWRLEQIEQGDFGAAGVVLVELDFGPAGEIGAQLGGDRGIIGRLAELLIVEEFFEGIECTVLVGEPEEEDFFERGLTMGYAVGRASEPLFCGFATAVDGGVGKFGNESLQQLLDAFGSDLALEPGQGALHDLWVGVLAVVGDERVAELVDEAHGEERGGIDGGGGIAGCASDFVDLVGQGTAGGKVGEDHVSGVAEENIIHLIAAAGGLRNVELHHGLSFGQTILTVSRRFGQWPGKESLL